MKNTVNVIVRISPELKKEAEEALKNLDVTLSESVRHHLRELVKQHHKIRAFHTRHHREFMEGELAQAAHDALAREVEAKRIEQGLSPGTPITIWVPDQPKAVDKPGNDEKLKFNENGKLDPKTMSRKLRRAYERDLAKGKI